MAALCSGPLQATAASTELAQLGRDLHLESEADSAAVLTSLLDHYRRLRVKGNGNGGSTMVPLDNIEVSSADVICVVALSATQEWLSESPTRADALMQYETFMVQLKEWNSEYLRKRDEDIAPYVSGLQVLLRMCMNSSKPSRLVLEGEIATGLVRIISIGDSSSCPGLAAAILAVCLIRCPKEGTLARLSSDIVAAATTFMRNIYERSVAGHQGQSGEAGAPFDADSFYMASVLLQLASQHDEDFRDVHAEGVFELVLALLDSVMESNHLLAISMALSILSSLVVGSSELQARLVTAGAIEKVIDLLSTLSLSKSSSGVPEDKTSSILAASAAEQQTEAVACAVRFLSDAVNGCPEAVAAMMQCYPGIIIRGLLRHHNSVVLYVTCMLVEKLSDGNAGSQRYMRLEEVLGLLVKVVEQHAGELMTVEAEGHSDVIVQACKALCTLLVASPDNHMYIASIGGTADIGNALGAAAEALKVQVDPALQRAIVEAMTEIGTVLSVLSRNMTNRRHMTKPQHLEVLVGTLETCHRSFTHPTQPNEFAPAAVKVIMFILVALVSEETNVARHLVERESFLPLLFSLLDIGPTCPVLDNTAALLLVLIRDCKINKTMLNKVGVPAIVRMLKMHKHPAVSATAVQALSGVLTLLAMSKTMLDNVLRQDGLVLVQQLLEYQPGGAEGADDAEERTISVHEAACVLISCLCEFSSRARQSIAKSPAIVEALVGKVLQMTDAEIEGLVAGQPSRGADPEGTIGTGTDVGSMAAGSQQQALVMALGQLMQRSGPDNYVYQAAMSAMRRVKEGRDDAAVEGAEERRQSMRVLEEEFGSLDMGRKEGNVQMPEDATLQLTLAAINTLFRVLHSVSDLAPVVWAAGGEALVKRVILLARLLSDSFEEAGTKLLVVFFSHRSVQDKVRKAGLIQKMAEMIAHPNSPTVLIATKALAVVCRNSPLNQAVAIDNGLMNRCIKLMHNQLEMYTAKWVILVINALVFENAHAQQIVVDEGAIPLMLKWLEVGPEQEVATAAARALAKASKGNTAVQNAILEANGMDAFVAMLNGKPTSLSVRAAAEALSDLAKDNKPLQAAFREAGAIARLLDLLRSAAPSSNAFVVTVVKALSVLAHANHENMETIYRLGGVPLLLEMMAPDVGQVSNAAAADLLRVLCSNELCQQQILRNKGMEVLLRTLCTADYPAALSATVWAVNALVQNQKSTLSELLHQNTIDTFMRCIRTRNAAAPGTIRLLLVVFLHSGHHDDLRRHMLDQDGVLASLLTLMEGGPTIEQSKWTASLLSTLCWQQNEVKERMVELKAPKVLASVLREAVACLEPGVMQDMDVMRVVVDVTISSMQALLSLIDESGRTKGDPASPSKALQRMSVQEDCVALVGSAGRLCMLTIGKLHGNRHDDDKARADKLQHLHKLLKPVLRALDWLLPMLTPYPEQVQELLELIENGPEAMASAKQHADEIRRLYGSITFRNNVS